MGKLCCDVRRILTRALPTAMLMFAVGIATLGCNAIAVAQSGGGDIICTKTQGRFLLPGDCLAGSCTLGGLRKGYCQLGPQSPGLARFAFHGDNATPLAQLYDNSVLRGPVKNLVSGGLAVGAACLWLSTMFTPYRCKADFAESAVTGTDFYMQFECGAMQAQATGNALRIDLSAFQFSPALLGRSIGHEMVHADQCARHETFYKKGMAESRLQIAFQELEAYSWEAAEDSFPRTFKVKATELNVITANEKQELSEDLECADWTVKDDLAQVIIRAGGVPQALRDYLTGDPWIKSVWLPNNPNWQHQQRPAMPKACSEKRMGI